MGCHLTTNWQGQKEGENGLMFVRDGTKFVENFSSIIDNISNLVVVWIIWVSSDRPGSLNMSEL